MKKDSYFVVKKLWEKRSRKYLFQKEGVLPKSFPTPMNEYLHDWMVNVVRKYLPENSSLVLDIGCGYGRISEEILKVNHDLKILGVDISESFVELYNKLLNPRGRAVKADMRKLPFEEHKFDCVFCITSLMYLLSRSDQKRALLEMFRVMKEGGVLIIIERNTLGNNILTVGGLITRLRGKKNREIPSVNFSPENIEKLIKTCGGKIKFKEAIPFFTILFYWIFLSAKINSNLARLNLCVVRVLDRIFRFWLTPSLYIAYIITNKNEFDNKSRFFCNCLNNSIDWF